MSNNVADVYAEEQKQLYQNFLEDWDPEDQYGIGVSGCWPDQETYPYEKHLLEFYETESDGFKKLGRCLDFGCGNGRMLHRMSNFFEKLDGCDFMQEHLEMAKKYLFEFNEHEKERFGFYLTNGKDSKINTPSDYYDFIYSTVVLIHVIPRSVRKEILKNHYELLKPGGRICHQMTYVDPEYVQDYYSKKNSLDYDFVVWQDPITGELRQNIRKYWNYNESKSKLDGNIYVSKSDLKTIIKDLEEVGYKNIMFSFQENPHNKNQKSLTIFREMTKKMTEETGQSYVLQVQDTRYEGTKWLFIHAEK